MKAKQESSNLSIDLIPKSWADIYGHTERVEDIKRFILNDSLPPLFLITGATGVGKNSIVYNIYRSLNCLNPIDPVTACGECRICKLDPRSTVPDNNIMWISPGSGETTVNSKVKAAMEYSSTPPMGIFSNPKAIKLIVWDEIQNIPSNLLAQILTVTETPRVIKTNRVVFILLTMTPEKIETAHPDLYQALVDRAGKGYIPLRPLSDETLSQYLTNRLDVKSLELQELLIAYSKGSVRRLISGYEIVKADGLDTDLDVAQGRLNLMSISTRRKFWELFNSSGTPEGTKQLKGYWDYLISKFTSEDILTQVIKDLEDSLTLPPLRWLTLLYLAKGEASYSPWMAIKSGKSVDSTWRMNLDTHPTLNSNSTLNRPDLNDL